MKTAEKLERLETAVIGLQMAVLQLQQFAQAIRSMMVVVTDAPTEAERERLN